MPRGSAGRKVARAAATGGSRRRRGQVPVGWYSSLIVVVLLGSAVVGWSRYEQHHPPAKVQPAVGQHWLAAYGIDVCGHFVPDLKKPSDASSHGITTDGDGLIHIDPKKASEAGKNATLGTFVSGYPGLELSSTRLVVPGKGTYSNGAKCSGKPAVIKVATWSSLAQSSPTIYSGNPAKLRLQNGQLVTIAFLPSGTQPHAIPKPPSAAKLASTSATTTTTTAPTSSTSSTAASSSTSTTAASSSTSTTAPKSSTTTSKSTTTTTKPASTTTKP